MSFYPNVRSISSRKSGHPGVATCVTPLHTITDHKNDQRGGQQQRAGLGYLVGCSSIRSDYRLTMRVLINQFAEGVSLPINTVVVRSTGEVLANLTNCSSSISRPVLLGLPTVPVNRSKPTCVEPSSKWRLALIELLAVLTPRCHLPTP